MKKQIGFAVPVLTLCLVFSFVLAERATALGLLKVDARNPRYFSDGTGKIIFLNAHTGCPFVYQDGWGMVSAPSASQLVADKVNFCRSWTWDNSRWSDSAVNGVQSNGLIRPLVFRRTGPGNALDGGLKFDLTQFDQNYFDTLRNGLVYADNNGIYVSIMLFQGYSGNMSGPWIGHYLNAANNINGINGDTNNDGDGAEIFSQNSAAVTGIQESVAKKMVDSFNDLDNIIWEVANEGPASSGPWQNHMADVIKKYESNKPKQHPVLISAYSPDASALFSGPADAIAPGASSWESSADPYAADPPPTDGSKVVILDTDHIGFTIWRDLELSMQWIWKSFTRGYNLNYQEMSGNAAAKAGGYTALYANKMNLAEMTPRGDLSSTGYALANPGVEYLVFLPGGGGAAVDLIGASGSFSVEWMNPWTGSTVSGSSVAGGGAVSFSPPFIGDAVLYLKSSSKSQSSNVCYLLDSSANIPAGFGASYNVFSSARELLLKAFCDSSAVAGNQGNSLPYFDVSFPVGNNSSNQYIYNQGYFWTGVSWSPFTFSCSNPVSNSWCVGSASYIKQMNSTELSGVNFYVAYICNWDGSSWKCGCRDSTCSINYWQLQAFKK
ncbi:cellulase family glycosylhydrolase [Candidatus Giovannonibacteria bacterium]|nr:cellulase family glycosylhydrolase [Candidatus Giovannonibacteria bacterium]